MIGDLRAKLQTGRLWIWSMAAVVLLGAALLGSRASILWLALPIAGIGAFALFQQPILGLIAMVPAALIVPVEVGTGSEVALNLATILVPALLGVWLLEMMRRGAVRLVPSATNRPLLLFLLAGLLSLVVGIGTWDPAVPRSSSFTLVQFAQWAMFVFSAIAFWLTGNLVRDEIWLQRLTFLFVVTGGALSLLLTITRGANLVELGITTIVIVRAPFWLLLVALLGGQLLFNKRLGAGRRLLLIVILVSILDSVFVLLRDTASIWIGIAVALGMLAWLRWPRLRWPVILLMAVLAVSGGLFSAVYEFAGDEWVESGGSRLALIGRVVEVTMRNPITGLGPAAYRPYAAMEPLPYWGMYWVAPQISSHNNYVDLFSHVGLLGLGLFFWFAVEVARLARRLRAHFREGFAAGYVNGMLAAGAGALVLMLFADWILPFVYNIGFPGFQASVLVWLFLGGLVALEQVMNRELAG
jgi:hypothetical protein